MRAFFLRWWAGEFPHFEFGVQYLHVPQFSTFYLFLVRMRVECVESWEHWVAVRGEENIWLLFSDCVLKGRSQEMGCSFNSWSCIALSFSIQRMHSCLLIAKDGEQQRGVCPMKKAENKHGTLIIWIYQKTQGTCKSLSISAWVVSRQLTIEPVC
jgi:hypothetical protein